MNFQENQITEFDEQLKKLPDLKWLPWIGQHYNKTKTVILGESQYEDGDEWQDDNIDATRILISKRFSGDRGKIYTNVEKVLLGKKNPTIDEGNFLWKSVTYSNLVPRLMSSIKERPNEIDFDNGWKIFFDLVEIINPKTCIVLGKSSWGRFCHYLNYNETGIKWERNISEFHAVERIINLSKNDTKIKLIFINHPSGSRGFNYEYWSKLISENEPSLRRLLTFS